MAPPRREARGGASHPYFTSPLPRVLAHRGLALGAAENTLTAFRRAVDAGATHLETDVRASADGEAVLAHDESLERVAGLSVPVRSLTARRLANVDLGHGEGVPTLSELLDAFPGARFNIDVKDDAAIEPAVSAIRHAGAEERVLVTSFSPTRQRRIAAALPAAATSPAWDRMLLGVVAAKQGAPSVTRRVFRDVNAIQFPLRSHGVPILTRRVLDAFRSTGCELHVWTVNDPATAKRLFALGIHGVVTDRADLMLPLARTDG